MHLVYNKILLVNPGRDSIHSSCEPLNLAYLASFLESEGVEVVIADQLSGEDVTEKFRRFQPDIVGLTATSALAADAYRLAEYFRGAGVPTVLGGVHATTFPSEALKHVNMVVSGEGEYALLDIMTNGTDHGVFTAEKMVDINAMPLPARHLLHNDYYLAIRKKFPQDGNTNFVPVSEKLLSVMITRGCPWNCAFCHNVWKGLPFRIYTPDKVIEELTQLKTTYGLKYVLFRDDNMFSNRKKIIEILAAMISSGLNMKWGANSRVDCLDREVLYLAREAGCMKLNFGFESGSQRILQELDKRTSVEKAIETVKLCKRHGIKVSGSFIIGHPNEDETDIAATRSVIRQMKLDSIGVALATPFPGTKWWDIAVERKLVPAEINWEHFDFDHLPIKLNEKLSAEYLKKMQKKYYLDAIIANPAYLFELIRSLIRNPQTFFKRIASVLGFGNKGN